MIARFLCLMAIVSVPASLFLTSCRRNEAPPFVSNAGEFLGELTAVRSKYEADSSIDNLREYQNFLHSLPGVSNWPCVVTSVDAPNSHDRVSTVVVHGTCGGTKVKLTQAKSARDTSSVVFDFLTNAKAGQTIYFTGVLDVGLNLNWDHPEPPPNELTFAVLSVIR